MFSLKNKLDPQLKQVYTSPLYKSFRVIIKCKNFLKDIEKKLNSYKCIHIGSISSEKLIFAEVNKRGLDRLLEFPEVSYIQFDEFCHICGGMSVSTANRVNFPDKYKLTGRGVSIGIIDTGVYPHTDLTLPWNKISGFKDFINNYNYAYDDNGHGTMVAGIISGSGYMSKNIFKGIAENSSLYVYKSFDAKGKGYISDILLAIDDVINKKSETNIKLLSLPFEYLGNNPLILDLFSKFFSRCINNNIIPIVPSGSLPNSTQSIIGFSRLDNCITVGGIDTTKDLKPYTYSSCGFLGKILKPDLSAAAKDILSLNTEVSYIPEKSGIKIYPPKLEKSYLTFSGTSCSCAYITGVCALIFENNPNLSFSDLLSLLKLSCEELPYDKPLGGEGYINLSKIMN